MKGYSIIKTGIYKLLEAAFLALLGCYLLYLMQATTTFYLPLPGRPVVMLLGALSGVAGFRAILQIRDWKQILGGLVCAGICFLSFVSGRYPFLLFIGILIIGCLNIDYKKILRLFSVLFTLFLAVTFLSALSGGIDVFVYLKDGNIRSSLGIIYPTDMASAVLIAMAVSWAAWDGFTDGMAVCAGLACIWFSRYIAMSITSTICGGVFAFFALLHLISQRIAQKRNVPERLYRSLEWVIMLAFPCCALLMFALIYAYSKGAVPAIRIDNLISGRLSYALNSWKEHGVHPFGSAFEMMGNGSTTYLFE